MILLIDNYDSFTYNLAHLFGELGAEVVVRRNDEITVEEAEELAPTHVVISPGPGRPEAAGVSEEIVRAFAGRKPVLGVCLGHQAIVEAYGGEELEVGRYHSLAATSVPAQLEICATAADGEIMGVRHLSLNVHGVQFHPESVLTPLGREIARNFLNQ